jgi:AcrR family transcriptional regulator
MVEIRCFAPEGALVTDEPVGQSPRDRILDAADRLFALGGVRGTGVNSIIASADVAKATFYRHFPSKDDLVATWLSTKARRALDAVAAETDARSGTPAERLDAFVAAFVHRAVHPDAGGFPFFETAMELRAPSPAVSRTIAAYFDEVHAWLAELAADAGSLTPDLTAAELRVLLFGVVASWRAHPSSATALHETTRAAAAAIVAAHRRPAENLT